MTTPNTPLFALTLSRLAVITAFFSALAIPLRASGVATEQAALGLALISALTILALEPAPRQHMRSAILSNQGLVVLSVFIAWAITITFSVDPLGSLEIGGRTALFTISSLVIWAVLAKHEEVHRFLWKTLVIVSILFAVLTLLSLNGIPQIASVLKGKGWFTPPQPDLSFKAFSTSVMCLIPAVTWAGRRLDGRWRWWSYTFAPLALGIMLLTYNRSALAGLIAMTLAGIFLLTLTKRRHAKAIIVTTLAAISSTIAWVTTREVHDREILDKLRGEPLYVQTYLPDWLLDPHRQNIWKFAYEQFLNHPLVGNGIDQLNRLPGANLAVPGLDETAAFIPSHPHNWVLEILAETGLIGFMPMVVVLAIISWKLMKNYTQHNNEADLALFTLTAGFWGSALFNFSIWAAWWQLTFLILFTIIAATRNRI